MKTNKAQTVKISRSRLEWTSEGQMVITVTATINIRHDEEDYVIQSLRSGDGLHASVRIVSGHYQGSN